MMMVTGEELEDTVVVDAVSEVAPTAADYDKKWWWVGVENVDDVDNFVPRKLVFEVQGNYSFLNNITVEQSKCLFVKR